MVIPDWTAPKPPQKTLAEEIPQFELSAMARPLDRLAAAIVDIFVLIVPVYILLSAPLKRVLTASFILGAESDFVSMLLMMISLAMSLIIAYQSLAHYFFGATLGKVLFDLRVRPVFAGGKLGFGASFGRSFFWVCECLCFGLPMLSVFSNSKRRPLHDRISDTCVISIAHSGVKAPLHWERGLVRGFLGACILFGLMLATLQVRRILEKMKVEHGLAALIAREESDCEVVSRNFPEDVEDEGHSRLELAMSLYAAGLAERSCLEAELEREMARQLPAAGITYLAQAFVNADDAEVSNSYLDQVCEDSPGTVECAMSKVVNKWSEEDWESVESLLGSADQGSGYLEVWAVRHYMKQANYQEALNYLNALTSHRELVDFSLVQRVRALYDLFREPEAEAALAQALPVLSKEDGEEISAWMCAQQLQNGCGALEKVACHGIPAAKELGEIDFEHSSTALSRLMALECHSEHAMDYLTFSEAVHDGDWKNFFRANLKHQRADNHAAFKLYAEVINSNSTPEVLRVEAVRRLAQFASRQQLASVVEMWRGFESKESWIKAGNLLLTRFSEKKDRDWMMRMARHLMTSEALSPKAVAILTDISHEPQQRKPASAAPPKEDIHMFLDSYEEEQ